jgi:diacylglycerol O-acyltransferase-1
MTCGAVVFFVSAVFHEYVISGALGYLNYWAFVAMFANFPISLIQEFMKKKVKFIDSQSQLLNVVFWITFCFLGQPLCCLLYFYNYYKENELNIPH